MQSLRYQNTIRFCLVLAFFVIASLGLNKYIEKHHLEDYAIKIMLNS